jgi:hypothetical protein
MPPPRLGKAAHERGLANERHVLEACQLEKRPEWMLRATTERKRTFAPEQKRPSQFAAICQTATSSSGDC